MKKRTRKKSNDRYDKLFSKLWAREEPNDFFMWLVYYLQDNNLQKKKNDLTLLIIKKEKNKSIYIYKISIKSSKQYLFSQVTIWIIIR